MELLAYNLDREHIKTLDVLYFAEIEVLNSSEYRKFNIVINTKIVCNVSLDEKNNFVLVALLYDSQEEVEFSLEAFQDEKGKSNRGPLISALEYYNSENATDGGDGKFECFIRMIDRFVYQLLCNEI